MNGRERALRTLRFEETDCTATWGGWIVSAAFFEYVTGKTFWDDPEGIAIEAYRKLGVDLLLQCIYLPAGPDEWRKHTDEVLVGAERFGSPEDIVAYVEALPDPESLEKEFDIEARMTALYDRWLELQEKLGDDVFCLPMCSAAQFTWYSVFGYESYLTAVGLYPDVIKRLYEHSGTAGRLQNMALVELVKAGKFEPFFFTGQDICGRRGPMISPDALRTLYYPSVKRALAPLVEIGADVIWHSDGYIIPMVDDLIACGVTGFQGFQEHTGFSVGDIARRRLPSGRKPLLLAGLSVDKTLPNSTVAQVCREVERIIDAAGAGGGLAVGTANTAGPDCPSENLEALYRHVHEYGRRNAS